MPFDIVIGRSKKDYDKLGTKGSVFIGKQYVKMGAATSLSNMVYMDMARSHIVFICGKRGGGKSYTMGVIAEGMASMPEDVKSNLAVILLDTMGIYWTMKYPNREDSELLKEWGIEPRMLDVTIYTPSGFYDRFKKEGIPTDLPFSIKPSDLDPEDWGVIFEIDMNSPEGILIIRAVQELRKKKKGFTIEDMNKYITSDKKSEEHTKNIVYNQLKKADAWGIFSEEGTPISELASPGKVVVLDVSPYATMANGWAIKGLVVGLVSRKLFTQRMIARKAEEFKNIEKETHFFEREVKKEKKEPLVWLVLDEAHELLPIEGKTPASDALITILREGRQPGISLILATQQPGKIHTDVMTQSDIVLSHRLTAKIDVDALSRLMQTYMSESLGTALETLPRVKGSAIVFDDMNERVFPIQVRPRFTWHGGSAPTAVKEKKKKSLFE